MGRVRGSAPNVLYVGSLIQGTSYLGGLGSMEELPIRQRAPLVVAVDLHSDAQVTDTVTDPNAASVQAALNGLVTDATSSGYTSGSSIFYRMVETYSVRQATLRLGLSYRYIGTSIDADLGYAHSSRKHTITAFFKQNMYTAFIVPPQTPAGFFSDAFTTDDLNEQVSLGNIGPGNLPVYVGRIEYGRMMMFTMTATTTADSMAAAVKASYAGASGSMNAAYQQILNESSFTIVTVGGDASDALSAIRSGSIKDYFASDDPLTTAKPLAYTLYNLADGSIATVSETTDYDVTECKSADALCYTNKTEWEGAVSDLVPSGQTMWLATTADSLVLAQEVDTPPDPNTSLGRVLAFDSAATGFPFTFRLQAGYPFVFDDREGSDFHLAFPGDSTYQANSLSVGDVDDHENDDFEVQIPAWRHNAAVFAIGITVGDNEAESGEFTQADGIGGFTKQMSDCVPNSPGTPGFLGIVSTVPLTRLYFNEAAGGDDIFIRDPIFSVLEWQD